MKKSVLSLSLAAFCVFDVHGAKAISIQINYTGGFTVGQMAAFAAAEQFWESALSGYRDPALDATRGITINAASQAIDGVGGVLGSAGPQSLFTTPGPVGVTGFTYVNQGNMRFDTADLGRLETGGTLGAVIEHEMAHVLGFGTLWTLNRVYVNGSGQFTGANALREYRAECDPRAGFVPVDIVSGAGTRDGHWAETWACGRNALMTGFLDPPTHVTRTTLGSFEDIGYRVNYAVLAAPIPIPASGALLVSAFAVMGLARHRWGAKKKHVKTRRVG